MYEITLSLLFILLTLLACSDQKSSGNGSGENGSSLKGNGSKFIPPAGTLLLFVGQDLQAEGGLEEYN